MSVFSPRRCAMLAVPAVIGAVGLAATAAAPAQAASPDVVISEVYGGGGNSGATYRNDFVELFNHSDAPVDVRGWVVRYFSAAGGAGGTATLSGSVGPHRSYLVQMAAGSGGTADLPTPDATGTAAMSATNGRIDLTNPGGVVDRVAYGTALPAEGTAAPGLSNTTSATRDYPCTDTDDNSANFRAGAPGPENSAVAAPACTVPPPVDDPETIAQIQGGDHLSEFDDQRVNGVAGVVTALGSRGFWMQSAAPDADIATSEGIFVFTSSAPTTAVGDAVLVEGFVSEFRPGGSGGNDNTTITEIVSPDVTVESSGSPLPAPVVIGVDRVAPQQTIEEGNPLNVEFAQAVFRPTTDAIDFYESLEGMYVGVEDAEVVGPTASFGEIPVVPAGSQATRSPAGGVVYGGYDQPNAMRLQLDDAIIGRAAMPDANVGDTLTGLTTGVVDYSFSNYKVIVDTVPALASGGLEREVAPTQKGSDLSVGTFNVENLAPTNPQAKFDRLAGQIIGNLKSPDILALEEIQDNNGAAGVGDGVVDSTATTDKLIAAITAAGGPAYEARWVNPQDVTDGGEPGGNIRSVFLFRPDRDVQFVDRPGGTATTATTVVTDAKGAPHLSASPGRVNPTSAAWASSRKPLVGEFRYRGTTVFAIANHFNSKGGDDPLFGRWQQPVRSSEVQRHSQAQEVRGFVDDVLAADAGAKVVVLGDINDFEFSETTDILVGAGASALTDLPRTLPANERYTYVFEGNSQVLDHILISPGLATTDNPKDHAYTYDIVHTNSQFSDQDSDHEPQVVHLNLKK